MGWGFGHHYRVPQAARDVAEAFYAGKKRTRTNCLTDGQNYKLEGTTIASRVRDEDITENIANALLGRVYRNPLEFSFNGWATQMTCRHLRALGLDCEIAGEIVYGTRGGVAGRVERPLMLGRAVDPNRWYTKEQLLEMPEWVQPVWVPPFYKVVDDRVVPRNMELNFA
jgi:hypothetical protein